MVEGSGVRVVVEGRWVGFELGVARRRKGGEGEREGNLVASGFSLVFLRLVYFVSGQSKCLPLTLTYIWSA